MKDQLISYLQALILSMVIGYLFTFFRIPLPWVLGPLFAVSFWQFFTKKELYMPVWLQGTYLLALGYILGSSFTRETALEVVHHFPSMLMATIFIIVISVGFGLLTARHSKLDKASVIVGSVPGGLSQMLVIGQEMKNINLTIVVFLQVIRLLAVVLIVPFLTVYGIEGGAVNLQSLAPSLAEQGETSWALYFIYIVTAIIGFLVAKRIGLPSSVLTGPIIVMALLAVISGQQAPSLPPMVVLITQLAMGMNLGLKVKPELLGSFKQFGVYTIGGSLVLVFSSFLFAFILTKLTSMSLSTAFLGVAPGGIAEMGMTAAVVHANLSMVSAYQLFRVLFILFIIVPLLKYWIRKKEAKESVA